MPRVAVVIPVRDRAVMVVEAIRSVLAQTARDLVLVVVDDGSSDGTREAAAAAVGEATVPARVLSIDPSGVAAARNRGVAATDSAWVAFLDSDDLWLPRKLERQLALVAARPGLRMAQTEERWIERGRHRNPRRWHRKEESPFVRGIDRCLVSPSAVMITRTLFEDAGGFDEAFPVCEDYELWLRLTRTERVGLVPEPLVVKRGGRPDQLSRSSWGLDRYRVAALVKLLLAAPLADAVRARVVATIAAKCEVLARGAERRGRAAEAARYRALAAGAAAIVVLPADARPATTGPRLARVEGACAPT